MSSTLDAALRSWPFALWLFAALVATAAIYGRGWLILRRRDPERWHRGKLAAFCGGLVTIYVALASPIEPFSAFLLSVHMTQHVLLTMIAPPLVWLGSPLFPMLRGLPQTIRAVWIVPLFRLRSVRCILARCAHPAAALPIFVAANWLWHLPATYDLALRSSGCHYAQHFCFLGSAFLFWYPVVRPYPARPQWSAWLLLPYLLAADVQNTLLSALLTFSSKPFYPYYVEIPRLAGLSAVEDQAAAGVIMWVIGSIVFLAPLCWIGVRLLFGDSRSTVSLRPARIPARVSPAIAPRNAMKGLSQQATSARFDLLRLPALGWFLKWRHARLALQLPLTLLAGVIIVDGLFGPQVGAMNLAGVLPWIHWRGLVVLALLVAGNVFCMGCPFMLPRALGRRFLRAGCSWPRWLRNKWLAVLLLALFFWSYEAFALWDSPRWTAWIVVGYFVTAFVIDGFFRGASFCKYVCPIGQFNFVQSLVSPLEVAVRQPDVCTACLTKDCIRGGNDIPGCQLDLFQPRKRGNQDCTVCLDCVHACPHGNVGILVAPPGRELWRDSLRSGIGRFSRRVDLAALILVLVFGAFANAAGMVGPVVDWEARARSVVGLPSMLLTTSLFYLFVVVVLPLVVMSGAAIVSRRWGGDEATCLQVATRFTYALVPLGFGMWLSHYCFHFFTSCGTLIPTTQRFAADFGWTTLGDPAWSYSCCASVADWIPRLQITFLDLGLLLSLYVGYRIAVRQTGPTRQSMKAFFPWVLVVMLLFAAGVWITLQPMQMRGTIPMIR